MPYIDMSKLDDPEKLLAEAESSETMAVKQEIELENEELTADDEKISINSLDKEEENDYTDTIEIEDTDKTLSESEEKAKKRGWKPKDEYQGDPDKWVPAEEFNRQTPLHDTIAELSSRAKKTESALTNLLKLFAKQEKDITTAQLEEAKALREDAILNRADPKMVDKFDAVIAEKSNLLKNPAIKVDDDESRSALPHENIHPLAKAYVEKNLSWWYADDAESKAKVAYASAREEQLVKQLGDRVPKIYDILEAEVAERFGKKKGNETSQETKKVISRAPTAEGVTRSTVGSTRTRSIGRADLDADDRDTYDVIRRMGGDTKVFLQALVKEGRIKQRG